MTLTLTLTLALTLTVTLTLTLTLVLTLTPHTRRGTPPWRGSLALWLQAPLPTVTGSLAYGYRLPYIWLQAAPPDEVLLHGAEAGQL